MGRSLVYSNIHLYRLAMNVLYAGGYADRFRQITALFDSQTRSVCDLCFGDTHVAAWCREHSIRWVGVDMNEHFCQRARRQGYEVIQGDLFENALPPADIYLMAGSLYHFSTRLDELFDAVFERTDRFIVSEPVTNLSAQAGPLGWIARRSADPGGGESRFRFDAASLRSAVQQQAQRLGLGVRTVGQGRDMLLHVRRPAAAGDRDASTEKAS